MKSDSPRKDSTIKTLWLLFSSMFYISAFTFGGGFVIVNLMKRRFVDELHWLDENEMMDLVSLAQSSPGAIAVNAANLVGWRMGGLPGMLAATVGTALPPMMILIIISFFYNAFAENRYVASTLRGMQAGVAAVIVDVVFQQGDKVIKERSILHIAMMALAFIATFFMKINAAWLLLAAVLAGLCSFLFAKRKEARDAD